MKIYTGIDACNICLGAWDEETSRRGSGVAGQELEAKAGEPRIAATSRVGVERDQSVWAAGQGCPQLPHHSSTRIARESRVTLGNG